MAGQDNEVAADGEESSRPSPWTGAGGPVLFEARLAPKRSLPRSGFVWVMAVAGVVSTGFSLYLWSLGAWPVIGFCGLNVALLYFAFRASYLHAGLYEEVRLTADELGIERVWPGGRRERWRLEPFWTRIELEGSEELGSRLALVSKGQRVVVGSFLSPRERSAFAGALGEALGSRQSRPNG
jgi:uncharacterized membrane protein